MAERPVPLDPAVCGLPGPAEECSFEQLVVALESLASRLSQAELGIEDAVDLYEQAELLHDLARQRLAAVTARIEDLAPKDR